MITFTCARNIFHLLYVNKIAKNGCFVVKRYQYVRPKHVGTQYARPKQGGTQYARGVTRMVMNCGTCIIFIRFRIPDQVYCNKSQNNNNFLLKKMPPPLLHRLGTVLHSPFVRMLVFMLKRIDVNVNENQQPHMQQNTYVQ